MTNTFFKPKTVTILSGATTSNSIDLENLTLCGIQTPAALTSTAITFTASVDNVTFVPLYDASTGSQISVTTTTSRGYVISPQLFAGVRYLKVVGGSSEGADRVITLLTRQIV
jgi:hypothetical protein